VLIKRLACKLRHEFLDCISNLTNGNLGFREAFGVKFVNFLNLTKNSFYLGDL